MKRNCALWLAAAVLAAAWPAHAQPLQVANRGTERACLTYQGKPVFAFGPMSETMVWMVRLGSPLYDVRAWAAWQQANGMNYVRCYPASGYGWSREVASHPDYLFPFEKASEEPLKFDLERFNPTYWDNFRRVAQTLKQHGIIVHLQVFQLCYFETNRQGDRWPFNFWNPGNNVNDFTRTMGPNGRGHHPIIEQIAEGNPPLRAHYLRYLDHLLTAVGDLGNVFFDLSNEMGDGGLDLPLVKRWVDLTLDHVEAWEKKTGHNVLVGQDIACFPDREYLLRHPRMELVIAHGNHLWRDWTPYKKPVVIVNSNDGRGLLYADESAPDRFARFRKLHWRALVSRAQGLGDYDKNWKVKPGSYPEFDRDARLLRSFFASLADYANLLPRSDAIVSAPGAERYCLASEREAVIYMESGARTAGVKYGPGRLELKNLPLRPGRVSVAVYSPTAGPLSETQQALTEGGLTVELPAFTDDLAVHLAAL